MFMSADQDRARLPVLLVTGFLGGGKTTLVNALLGDPRLADTAVAVNEFGETALDQHLIAGEADSTVVLANGCLCCNLGGDVEAGVMRVFSRRAAGDLPRFRRLILELSGLADPAPIAQALLRNPVLSRVLRLEAIVTVVDALFAHDQIERHPETRKQISLADQLVVTKTDLADDARIARVTARLDRLNPVAPVHRAADVVAEPTLILPVTFLDPDAEPAAGTSRRARITADDPVAVADHSDAVRAVTLTADAPLDWTAFDAWLRDLRLGQADALLRAKGLVNVAGVRRPVAIHGVHHVLHTPVELSAWPDADRRTRIVLIVQGLSPETLACAWEAALPALAARPAAA
jgi:G3E family GTPase